MGDNLNETNQSQPTPYNSQELSPVLTNTHKQDDNMVELEASQDELDALDCDESTEQSMETSQETNSVKHQLHVKCKQIKKKQAKKQHLRLQLAETDHQLDLLHKKTAKQPTVAQSSDQPVATSTPQPVAAQDQSWLQQADIDAADAFLNQLDETPAKSTENVTQQTDKSNKTSKKRKLA